MLSLMMMVMVIRCSKEYQCEDQIKTSKKTYLVSVPLVLAILVLLDLLPTLLDQSPSPKSFVQQRLGHFRAVVVELILMNGKIAPPFM